MLVPARVGAGDVFRGLKVHMAAKVEMNTPILTEGGKIWSCGQGEPGVLHLNDIIDQWVPTLVEGPHLCNSR